MSQYPTNVCDVVGWLGFLPPLDCFLPGWHDISMVNRPGVLPSNQCINKETHELLRSPVMRLCWLQFLYDKKYDLFKVMYKRKCHNQGVFSSQKRARIKSPTMTTYSVVYSTPPTPSHFFRNCYYCCTDWCNPTLIIWYGKCIPWKYGRTPITMCPPYSWHIPTPLPHPPNQLPR